VFRSNFRPTGLTKLSNRESVEGISGHNLARAVRQALHASSRRHRRSRSRSERSALTFPGAKRKVGSDWIVRIQPTRAAPRKAECDVTRESTNTVEGRWRREDLDPRPASMFLHPPDQDCCRPEGEYSRGIHVGRRH